MLPPRRPPREPWPYYCRLSAAQRLFRALGGRRKWGAPLQHTKIKVVLGRPELVESVELAELVESLELVELVESVELVELVESMELVELAESMELLELV